MFFINQIVVRRREILKSVRLGLSLAVRSEIRRLLGTSADESNNALLGTLAEDDKSGDAYDLSDDPIRGYNDDEWSYYRCLGFLTPIYSHQLDCDDERYFVDAAYKRWTKATELRSFYRRSLHTQSSSKRNGRPLHIPCTIKDVKCHGYHPWRNRDLALAHGLYRQMGKDIICNLICCLLNEMMGFSTHPTPFSSDMIEDLRICGSPVSLIQVVKRQLTELFPPVIGPNFKIRDDFIDEVNKMVEENGKMEENLKMLWNLLEHPLLHSIEWRSSFICQTFDRYQNYGHEIVVEGYIDRNWRIAYNEVVVKKDSHRMEEKTHIFDPDDFVKMNDEMAMGLNSIRDKYLKHQLERDSRVGHFFLFRHGSIHINEHTPWKIHEEVVAENLHYHLGLVTLDCKDFHIACVDRVDHLDVVPCIMEDLFCDP